MDQNYRETLRKLIGQEVSGTIDRPLGSHHPNFHDTIYPVNYGYVDGLFAPDGKEQDVYFLGVDEPLAIFKGTVIAIVERKDDVEDKLVVVPTGLDFSNEEIEEMIQFQEKYFRHSIYR